MTGRPFAPGANSHTGEVFRRGKDRIPRGRMTLMLRVVYADQAEVIYDSLCRLVRSPKGALIFARELMDRTEGLPVKRVQAQVKRTTQFIRDPGTAPVPAEAKPAEEVPLRLGPEQTAPKRGRS